MQKVLITKDKTAILKGFAILFMIAHHVLIKEYYIDPSPVLDSFFALRLQIGMKTCVGIFTFILGYGFFFTKKYDAKYVLSHAKRLLLRYWFVLIPTIAAAYWRGYLADIQTVILNCLGIMHQYNLGNWYIYFYLFAIIALPIIKIAFTKNEFVRLAVFVAICGALTYINNSTNSYMTALRECTRYTPLLAIGFVCAKTDILSRYSVLITSRLTWIVIAVITTLFRCCISGAFGIVTDVVTVPIFVIAISGAFRGLESNCFTKALIRMGQVSAMMWFIHALPFSSATKALFQGSGIWTNNIVTLFLSVTLLSYLTAEIFESAVRKLQSLRQTAK